MKEFKCLFMNSTTLLTHPGLGLSDIFFSNNLNEPSGPKDQKVKKINGRQTALNIS